MKKYRNQFIGLALVAAFAIVGVGASEAQARGCRSGWNGPVVRLVRAIRANRAEYGRVQLLPLFRGVRGGCSSCSAEATEQQETPNEPNETRLVDRGNE